MARVRQRYKILQRANERLQLPFGRNGQFESITRYNPFTDSFTLSIFSGLDAILNEQPLLPGIILNLYSSAATLALSGNLWINVDYIPSARDIGKSVELVFEFENNVSS